MKNSQLVQSEMITLKFFLAYFEDHENEAGYQSVIPVRVSKILDIYRKAGGVDVAKNMSLQGNW